MSDSQKIVAQATCRPKSGSPVVVVGCAMVYTATYQFKIVSQKGSLVLPYAVAINGKIHPEYANAPKKLNLSGKNHVEGHITVNAQLGDTVALYLGSDASKDWRQEPMYTVQLNEKNAVVHVEEKLGVQSGWSSSSDDVKPRTSSSKKADEYEASLTGNTWMRFSHRYTAQEVLPRLPEGTSAEVARAVQSIYQGLPQGSLLVQRAGPDGTAQQVTVYFPDDRTDNCHRNIHGYNMLADGLTRVHPAGYATLINAALDSGVASVKMTSCWRPMLGSIAHRLGLGLDVGFLDAVRFNRQELNAKNGKPPPGKQDADANVSEEEKLFYKAWVQAKQELEAAEKEEKRLSKFGTDEKKTAANDRLKNARITEIKTKGAWNKERDKHEPPKVQAFRESLYTCPCVSQLFDPWFMDSNTRDKVPAQPNVQLSDNEKLHAHHLHITVLDKKILP